MKLCTLMVLQSWKLICRLFFLFPPSPIYNVGRSLQVLLSSANIDLGGGGEGVENSDKYEKYMICLEVFNNLSLYFKKVYGYFFHDCTKSVPVKVYQNT